MTKKKYEVYLTRHNGKVVYVGEGVEGRSKHVNSGTSHVYALNKLHFEGVIFKVEAMYFDSKQEARDKEVELINTYSPEFNKMHMKNKSGGLWIQKNTLLRFYADQSRTVERVARTRLLKYIIENIGVNNVVSINTREHPKIWKCLLQIQHRVSPYFSPEDYVINFERTGYEDLALIYINEDFLKDPFEFFNATGKKRQWLNQGKYRY